MRAGAGATLLQQQGANYDEKPFAAAQKNRNMKRSACEGCHRSRVKCVYLENENTCVRCARQQKECLPRVVIRSKGQAGANEGINQMSDLDLDAYRSVSVFEGIPHLALHLSAAASMVRTYKSLGMSSPPVALQWTINLLYLLAQSEKSMGLLHTAAALSVSCGVQLDLEGLNSKISPLTEEQSRFVENYVHSEFFVNTPEDAFFIIRLDRGERGIVANKTYEWLFETASNMADRLAHAPHFRLWRQFVEDQTICDRFTSEIVKNFLQAGEPHSDPPQIEWTTTEPGVSPVKIRDAQNRPYTAELFERGVMAGQGFLTLLVFGFRNIKPMNKDAEEAINTLKASVKMEVLAPVKPPHISRFDSLFSEMLPPPLLDETTPGVQEGELKDIKEDPAWKRDLPRMDSKEFLDALGMVVDSVGGREEIENGQWRH